MPQYLTFQGVARPFFCAEVGQIARPVGVVDVLHPLRCFLYGTGVHVGGQIGLSPEELTEVQELVRSKAVVFAVIAPPQVLDGLALALGPYAFFPVIGIGKTTTRPAQVGDLQVPERFDDIVADAVGGR